jgi:hypothetical protein
MGYSDENTLQCWYEDTVDNVLSWLEEGGARAKEDGREIKL